MMSIKNILISSSLLLLIASFSACNKHQTSESQTPALESTQPVAQDKPVIQKMNTPPSAMSLPVRYQTPTYMVGMDVKDDLVAEEATALKVGASIRSTRGPQPLWDILKRLAALKRMNVSWASDVDQNVLVDVDINANDDFYESVDNLLRQVEYFHEMQGKTIVVKNKETRRFHIAMPYGKQSFSTGTGGNVLGGSSTGNATAGDVDGTIQLKSVDIKFDLWTNIEENLNNILDIWTTAEVKEVSGNVNTNTSNETASTDSNAKKQEVVTEATRKRSNNKNSFMIDRTIGMITATAPRPLLDRVESYIKSLQEEVYKQITIEAKIIEVQLNDSSSIGINWSQVLKNFAVNGTVEFGGATGQIYPSNGESFISKISLSPASFGVFLNAIQEQGDARILSNPKLSVMNGLPALLTVGRNITYIDSIESETDTDTNATNFTVNTERILSGIGMALTATILDNKQIIMNLVPVTSELEEPIEYRSVGNTGAEVGLPIVNVREMSTTVKVNDGEMLVIGGLISSTDDRSGEFAPVLGDIPILRYLFGFEEKVSTKRELIILLRPRII